MFNVKKIKLLISLSLAIILFLLFFSSSAATEQVDSFSEIQEKLTDISNEEREILQNLFILVQEIEEMEKEELKIAQEIQLMAQDLKDLEAILSKEEAAYEEKRNVLKYVLQSYQRGGPGTYLEILLTSDNLSTFLRSINVLRDLTRNTGNLLEELDTYKEKLSMERADLAQQLARMDEKQHQLQESLAKTLQLREEKESYLTSLNEEREFYQEYLTSIQQVWNDLKPLFAESTKEFSRIIEAGNLPTDALKISFNLFSITGTIDEQTINDVILNHASIPEMVFRFQPGKVQVEMPTHHLILAGTFDILEGHTLKFIPTEGSFYGMSLTSSSIEELFIEGDLILNLKPLLHGSTINSVEILEGYIQLTSRLSLF